MNYKDYESTRLAPPTMRGPEKPFWAKFWQTLGDMKDRISVAVRDANKVRMPLEAPSDALPFIAKERNIERYLPENDAVFASKLQRAWTIWDIAGTKQRILDALAEQGLTHVRIYAWRELSSAPPPYANWWSSFFVIIDQANPWHAEGVWGTGTWGDTTTDGTPGLWGTDATAQALNFIRAAIKKWRPATEICGRITIVFSNDLWEPLTPWAEGTWGGTAIQIGPV